MDIVPSRRLGQDNQAVYSDWLGIPEAELEELERNAVI